MPASIRGRLIASAFASEVLPSLPAYVPAPDTVRAALEQCGERIEEALGPASGIRAITDIAVAPLVRSLGLAITAREDEPALCRIHTAHNGASGPLLLVLNWGESLGAAWRRSVLDAIANDARWCICCNGVHLRVVDARRTWIRDYIEFDLMCLRDREGQDLLWSLLRAEAITGPITVLETAIAESARHGSDVCRALGRGVLEALAFLIAALRGRRRCGAVVFEHALTVLYRILFLLFAEARGLVPLWHPVYRDRYSLDSIVSALLAGQPCRGLWEAVLAISRLAHAGCAVGELNVTAFNGRLFAPAEAETFDRTPIADDVMRNTMVSVSSVTDGGRHRRRRIAFRDLDVEQLGAVYEQVLDYEPSDNHDIVLVRTRHRRKSSGAFYTPRALTSFLVRRTLGPLIRGRSADDILQLKILDPAMGSGAFLVAVCRFLAAAAEEALIAEGRWHAGDVVDADRALLRRDIASRCLYGVDVNPMAVQLARLSLWLATLAFDKPLSFLDHHLVTGDSLVGATPGDVQRQPSGGIRGRRPHRLSLFDAPALTASLADAAAIRSQLALEPDETAAVVREKERTLNALSSSATVLNQWKRVLDLWCAGWFWENGPPPDKGTFADLVALLLQDRSVLSPHVTAPLLTHAAEQATGLRFFHWPLVFPEVFANGGFDAVIGNPPWDMVRGDSGDGDARATQRRGARQATKFFRESGIYSADARAHVNRYQLFAERTLQLLHAGGRCGLVLPAGVVTDTGSAPLRRLLFDRSEIDSITGLDNRAGIFPIHRSVRFAIVTATAGRRTDRIRCRFGLSSVEELDSNPPALELSRELLGRLSGHDDLAVPELVSDRDLRIVEGVSARVRWLGDPSGWGARFGRELNATDDRTAFVPRSTNPTARAIVEGKHVDPFRVRVERSRFVWQPGSQQVRRVATQPRLGYREVASATNRLTLIAAILPPSVVSTHTVFCLKTALPIGHQYVLCALLNSFVANYLVRLRVNTHVTSALMSRLAVPVIEPTHPTFARLRSVAETLGTASDVMSAPEYAELQALVASLYGLTVGDFEHILSTFPLIPTSVRVACFERFTRVTSDTDKR